MRIFSNLAVTIDGKIADAAAPRRSLGTPLDRRTMDKLRAQADVVLTGSSTLKAFPATYRVRGARKGQRQPANAILTRTGELDPKWKFWDDPEVVRFVFTTESGFTRALEAARERAFVVIAGRDDIDLDAVLGRLKRSGLSNVLVEGGGEMIASFLRAKLLQEMYVTLTPWALGGKSNPGLVGGDGALWSGLKLLASKKVKDEIYLHYRVKGARRV